METLVQLFPSHPPRDLRRCLDRAHGVLEVAIETVLATTHPRADTRTQRYIHVEEEPSRKRVKRHSSGVIAVVNEQGNLSLDLTLDSSDNDDDDDDSVQFLGSDAANHSLQGPQGASSGQPSFEDFHNEQQTLQLEQAQKAAQMEDQRRLLVTDFIAIAQDMFDNISVPYLEKLIAETRPKISSDNELVEACIERIFALRGKYPKTKRKRRDRDESGTPSTSANKRYQLGDEDDGDATSSDEEEGGPSRGDTGAEVTESRPAKVRDYMEWTARMTATYETHSAIYLYQDFPKIAANSIRTCLKKFNFHYAPAFDYLNGLWAEIESDGRGKSKADEIKIVSLIVPRKKAIMPKTLDAEFKKEMEWVKAKIAKELEELQAIEEEERNINYYKDRNELIECGCCYDDVPPNRVAQCEDGHLFCFECSKRGAEVELGYRRTILKCMAAGCAAVFIDSEAIKFLPKSVFLGLLRARQQEELKMAGLESLVECPFCSYAAVVENDLDKEFRCQAPRCRKVSCRLCKAPTHIPQSCEEYRKEQEKNNVLTVQHKVEEEMSQALIRECPKCSSRFFKTEGCNKMTCTKCGTKMCYICKKQIKDYSHFDQAPAGQPSTSTRLCRLWDNTVERNANDVKEAAQRMMNALQMDKPDLAAQVRLDVP